MRQDTRAPSGLDPFNGANGPESDIDSMYVPPLNIIPLETPSLRRARLIKNICLETVVELFNSTEGGSRQIPINEVSKVKDWPRTGLHPDETKLSALSSLRIYDVYSLRIQIQKLKMKCYPPKNADTFRQKARRSVKIHERFHAAAIAQNLRHERFRRREHGSISQ